jgi:hypothetical protein
MAQKTQVLSRFRQPLAKGSRRSRLKSIHSIGLTGHAAHDWAFFMG